MSTLGDVKSKNCDLLSACLMPPKLQANHWRKKILPEIIRFMCFWDINKNAKCKNAFVRSADPGIYSSIVSDLKDEFYDLELKENVMKFLSNVKTSWIDDARVL